MPGTANEMFPLVLTIFLSLKNKVYSEICFGVIRMGLIKPTVPKHWKIRLLYLITSLQYKNFNQITDQVNVYFTKYPLYSLICLFTRDPTHQERPQTSSFF